MLWSFEVTLEVVDGRKCRRVVDNRRSHLLLVGRGHFDGLEFVRGVVVLLMEWLFQAVAWNM